MNGKIRKVIREIENVELKILEWQEKLKQLNAEKVELENLEIVAMFRGYKVSSYEIENVMNSFKAYHENETGDMPIIMPKTNLVTKMEDNLNEDN